MQNTKFQNFHFLHFIWTQDNLYKYVLDIQLLKRSVNLKLKTSG